MKALGDAVMRDPLGRTPIVQTEWQAWEREWLAGDLEARIQELLRRQARLLTQLGESGG